MPCSQWVQLLFLCFIFATSWPGFFFAYSRYPVVLLRGAKNTYVERRFGLLVFIFIHSKSFATKTRVFTECIYFNVSERNGFFSWFCLMLSLGVCVCAILSTNINVFVTKSYTVICKFQSMPADLSACCLVSV